MINCANCNMYKMRKNVVAGSGDVNAEVLFITDPPGMVEELTNDPLSGHCAILINSMLKHSPISVSFYVVPVIMCRPDSVEKITEYILHCQDNVEQIIKLISPRLIVCLGDLAYQYYKNSNQNVIKLTHPNYLMKTGGFNAPQYLPMRNKLNNKIKEVFSANEMQFVG